MRHLAFDSDVLIYATSETHPYAPVLRSALFAVPPLTHSGSVLLYPELLSKPMRTGQTHDLAVLRGYLGRLMLVDIGREVALMATELAAAYRLKAPDALHLACAVHTGADAFVTNNRKDFKQAEILELQVLYPEEVGEG